MIELNIIKSRLENFRKKRIIFNVLLIYFACLFLIIALLSINILFNRIFIKKTIKEIDTIKSKIEAEKDKVIHIKENEKEIQLFLKSMNLFTEESNKRIEWAPILAFVGERVPSGMWLERFESKEATPQGKTKGEVSILLSGYIVPAMVNEREVIDKMVCALNTGNIFSGVYLKEVKKVIIGDTELLTFKIECRLKQKEGGKDVVEIPN